jgi:hypothetical protein
MKQAKCRSCGRDIVWARGPSGKKIALERARVYTTSWAVLEWVAELVKLETYVSHFSFCPKAQEWLEKEGGF